MRRLHPDPCDLTDTAGLATAYAYPDGPWLRVNFVASADGAATWAGHSEGLSSGGDKRVFTLLRGLADVIITGAGTVRTEGYAPVKSREIWAGLRSAAGQPPTPPIAVVSRHLDLDLDAPLFTRTPSHARTIVLTCEVAPQERREAAARVADVMVAGDERVDPDAAVGALAERGHTKLLCEGGPTLFSDIVAAGRLDELCLTVSPLLVAGSGMRIADGPPLAEPAHLELAHVLEDDGNLLLRYTRRGR